MKTSDFTFELPEELIAQDPLADRSSSRLLVLDKETGIQVRNLKICNCLKYSDTI